MGKRRFRQALLHLLFAASCGSAVARQAEPARARNSVLVFTDGTRVEVHQYEIRETVVVFTTLDGKLRSVPRSFVDLGATAASNGFGGPASSEHRDRLPDVSESHAPPPQGSTAARAATAGSLTLDGPPAPVPPEVVHRDAEGRVTLRAVRLKEPLVVDGKLEELIYRRVRAVDGFIQAEPDEGAPATEKTEVWVSYDDDNVYISARCWDSHPERMVANELRRDSFGLFLNENFAVVLDSFYDRRNAIFFYTNPLGGLFDGLITDENDVNRDWNTVWEVKTGRFANGWTVEMEIPFKSLRYRAAGPQVWGINFRRIVRWKNEFSYLTRIPASFGPRGMVKISSAATLVGLETPPRSKNLEVKPYLKADSITDRESEPPLDNDLGGDVGLDVKYGVTRGLIFDFTVNTDFAQVEVDEQQVNLTRFSLFFPEKREFFLEGRGIFSFGGVNTPRPAGFDALSNTPIIFYTRRIGLQEGQVIPILVGARLAGRVGPYSIGALSINTREVGAAGAPATNFSLLRIKRDVLRRSAIGVIGTLRSPAVEGGGNNTVFGVDAALSFYDDLNINAYFAVSKTPGGDEDSASYLAQLDWQPDLYGLKVERLVAQRGFNPEMGFMRREAFERNFVEARISRRPASIAAFRKLSWIGAFDYTTDNEGRLETRTGELTFRLDLENSDQLNVTYRKQHELLPEEFEISDGVVLPSKDYDFQNLRLRYQFGPQRKVSGWLTFQTGGFFSGKRRELTTIGRVEITPKFSVEPRLSLNWVDLEEGDFRSHVVGGRINYTFSARTVLSGLIQYSGTDDVFSSNIRFRWEYEPGSDLFVVYTDAYDTLGAGLPALQNRSLVMKFTRLFRF